MPSETLSKPRWRLALVRPELQIARAEFDTEVVGDPFRNVQRKAGLARRGLVTVRRGLEVGNGRQRQFIGDEWIVGDECGGEEALSDETVGGRLIGGNEARCDGECNRRRHGPLRHARLPGPDIVRERTGNDSSPHVCAVLQVLLNDGLIMRSSILFCPSQWQRRLKAKGVCARSTGTLRTTNERVATEAVDAQDSCDQEAEGGARGCAMRREARPTNAASGAPTGAAETTTACGRGRTPWASGAPALNPGQ